MHRKLPPVLGADLKSSESTPLAAAPLSGSPARAAKAATTTIPIHRQIGRLLTLENAAGIDADLAKPFGLTHLTVGVSEATSIANQAAAGGELAKLVDRRHRDLHVRELQEAAASAASFLLRLT
jgi:hypothetical protein